MLAPEGQAGPFEVCNHVLGVSTRFAGDTSSFLDRQLYLFGQYEEDSIRAFVKLIEPARRGIVLDVGANVGTHSLAFARQFAHVHAFEPNAALWGNFGRNIEINRIHNVTLHRVGLADRSQELPFYSIAKNNFGLGTFSTVEQYDLPLQASQVASVVRGDDYMQNLGVDFVDAIKIDVQGFEPEVLRGLAQTLAESRPYVWFEVGRGWVETLTSREDLSIYFPYRFDLFRFSPGHRSLRARLDRVTSGHLETGDYVVAPHN